MLTKQELHDYDYAAMRMQDARGATQLAVKIAAQQSFTKGVEQGKKQGIEEGKKQGIEKGKQQGIEEEKISTANEMITAGLSIDLIMQITKLDKEVIEKLIKDHNNK